MIADIVVTIHHFDDMKIYGEQPGELGNLATIPNQTPH